ncbi:MAG TPA: maleylacetoacetate isomerase [Steroidobacteraceae bacterium]|nr:maleylacetoacetate isomerase [Steroidobacteraceae bacterium]
MSDPTLKLFTFFRSSAAYRARIALNIKGIAYETVNVDLRAPTSAQHAPEYRAVNPQGLIPALLAEGTTIAQSLAIIEYLDEVYPQPPLLPGSAVDRARVRAMALAVACDIHPLNNLRVLNYLRGPLGQTEDAVNTWYHHWIAAGFGGLEAQARGASGDGHFMFGKSLTIADIYIVPQMYNARRLKCDVEPYPTLRGICAHLETLPAFAAAAPEAQPGAG